MIESASSPGSPLHAPPKLMVTCKNKRRAIFLYIGVQRASLAILHMRRGEHIVMRLVCVQIAIANTNIVKFNLQMECVIMYELKDFQLKPRWISICLVQ